MGSTRPVYKLLKHQSEFVHSPAKYSALVAGYGAGKTVAFSVRTLKECGRNPGKRILIAEPTFPMVRDVLQPTFESVLHELNFPYEYHATELRYRVRWKGGWADVLMRSAENYLRWAGLNIAAGGIDEADQLRDDRAWQMLLSRLRDGNTLNAYISTTPEGFKWVYRYWQEEKRPGYKLTRGRTEDNIMLPEEFIDSLKENYDERLLRAYLNGEFVNLQLGATYYVFDRDKNVVPVKYNPSMPIRIGIDFNVDPMEAVLWQKYSKSPRYRVYETVSKKHTGEGIMTDRLCKYIKDKYPNSKIIAFPDPSGKNRGTSSERSDHQIIRDNGFEIKAKTAAPSVVDRVNAVNRILAKDCIIDPSCKPLIRDFEQVTNKKGTRDIDKSNPILTHSSDSFGYGVDFEDPVRKPFYGSVGR